MCQSFNGFSKQVQRKRWSCVAAKIGENGVIGVRDSTGLQGMKGQMGGEDEGSDGW